MKLRRRWRWVMGMALIVVLAAATVPTLLGGRNYRGRRLDEWLHRPGLVVKTVSIAQAEAHRTNAAAAFHEAGQAGMKVLLGELAASENRLNWLWFRWKYPGLSIQEQFWHSPQSRSWEVRGLIDSLPPPSGESFRLLTNEFLRLADTLTNTGTALTDAFWQKAGVSFTSQDIRSAREDRLVVLAGWISRNRVEGVGFLTNQMFTSTSSMTQGAVLRVFADMQPSLPEAVPVAVHAASDPMLCSAAAQLLTRLHREPAVAIPVLMRRAAQGGVSELSSVGEWGTNALPWLPQLLPLTTNSDPQVSFQAEIAVRKIRGAGH